MTLAHVQAAPGPKGRWPLHNLPYVQRDPLHFLRAIAHEYGPVVNYPLAQWKHVYLIAHPDAVRHVLVDNSRNYSVTHPTRDAIRVLFGAGLFTSEGELWLRQRRLMQPIFHRHHMAAFGTLMTTTTEAMLQRWSQHEASAPSQPLDLAREMTQLALEIDTKAVFGVDLGGENRCIGEFVTTLLALLGGYLRSPAILLPTAVLRLHRRFAAVTRQLDEAVYQIIARRAGANTDDGSLLSLLLQAQDEATGERMSHQQLRDEVMTLLVAGHETTANALAWLFYLLSQSPEVEERLRVELAAALDGRAVTPDDLTRLPYLRMVIDESLRVYPPLWITFRRALETDTIMGYSIPANARLTISPYVIHRHPDFWEHPDTFDPARFSPDRAAGRHSMAYFPFGAGPRQCIGKHFAMMEMQLAVATILQRYRLRLPPGHIVEPDALITLRPRGGLPMLLSRS